MKDFRSLSDNELLDELFSSSSSEEGFSEIQAECNSRKEQGSSIEDEYFERLDLSSFNEKQPSLNEQRHSQGMHISGEDENTVFTDY